MDLQLVAHEETKTPTGEPGPLNLYVVPARKQVVRTAEQALAVDSTGSIKLHVLMRQETALGLEKIHNLLDTGAEDVPSLSPASPPTS